MIMKDLTDSRWIRPKGILFLVIGVVSSLYGPKFAVGIVVVVAPAEVTIGPAALPAGILNCPAVLPRALLRITRLPILRLGGPLVVISKPKPELLMRWLSSTRLFGPTMRRPARGSVGAEMVPLFSLRLRRTWERCVTSIPAPPVVLATSQSAILPLKIEMPGAPALPRNVQCETETFSPIERIPPDWQPETVQPVTTEFSPTSIPDVPLP